MSDDLGLTLTQRLHLGLHNLLARTGVDGLRPLRLTREGEWFALETGGQRVLLPAALLWRSYRRGWQARLDRLTRDFGLGDPFAVGPGDTVIDIGANVGDFARAVAAHGAQVLAIDGDPTVIACLKRNIEGLSGIDAECAILWKEATEVVFYSAPGRADSSIFLPPGEGVPSFRAQATTLDRIAQARGIGEIALLKMDAEGAEPEVLEGAPDVLARTRAVTIDTGPERNGETTTAACEAILEAAGFRILRDRPGKRIVTLAVRAG